MRATSEPRWPLIQEWRRVPPRRLRTPESGRSTAMQRTVRPRDHTTDQVFSIGRRRRRASTSSVSPLQNCGNFTPSLNVAYIRAWFLLSSPLSSSFLSRIFTHSSCTRRYQIYTRVAVPLSPYPFLSRLSCASLTILSSLSRSIDTMRIRSLSFPILSSGLSHRPYVL